MCDGDEAARIATMGDIRETYEEARVDAERIARDHERSCTVFRAARDGSFADPGFWKDEKERERISPADRFRDR